MEEIAAKRTNVLNCGYTFWWGCVIICGEQGDIRVAQYLTVITSKEVLEAKFYQDVRRILKQARKQAYGNANGIMTHVYWNVGKSFRS